MTTGKTLALSLAGAIFLAAHPAPSFASKVIDAPSSTVDTQCADSSQDDLWYFILSWLR
jgi:hypothetical protein